MPKMYRLMLPDSDKPRTGSGRDCLGVRTPTDIEPDAHGEVHPGTKGMSGSSCVCCLIPSLLPPRLRRLSTNAKDAIGSDSNYLWRYGEGPFISQKICRNVLYFATTPSRGHGC